jgi:hypothetical protein
LHRIKSELKVIDRKLQGHYSNVVTPRFISADFLKISRHSFSQIPCCLVVC